MEKKKIIACLDIKDGKTSKGVNFKNNISLGDPYDMAMEYYQDGIDEIVIYDIQATAEKRIPDRNLIYKIAKNIDIPVTIGGGISSLDDIKAVLDVGAEKISINSFAINNTYFINEAVSIFGTSKICIGIDAKKVYDRTFLYEVFTGGGLKPTQIELSSWVETLETAKVGSITLNSIDADGEKSGYDIPMINSLNTKLPIIASGGAGTKDHILNLFLQTKADYALLASMLHYKIDRVKNIKSYLKTNGINVN